MASTSAGVQGTTNSVQNDMAVTDCTQATWGRSRPVRHSYTNTEALVCLPDGVPMGAFLRQSQHPDPLPPYLPGHQVPTYNICCRRLCDGIYDCSILLERKLKLH
jgi:hypothetical protein